MGIVAARQLGSVAVLAATLWGAPALAFTPAEVLTATPPSERSLRQAAAVEAAARALGAASAGTDIAVRASPAASVGADIEDPAAASASLDLTLALAVRFDRAAVLAGRADLLRARERLRHWRRSEVRDALRLLGKTLRAEVALSRAELDLARARRGAPNGATGRARALVATRRHALESLQADADELGFAGPARLTPFAFAVPAAPEAPPAGARLALALAAARLDREAATTFAVLRDVSLRATFESRTHRIQLSGALSLDRGRPAASLGGELGNQQDDQWSVRLSADIRLDAGGPGARSRADERVRRAEAELASTRAGYRRRVREARAAVEDARAAFRAERAAWQAQAGPPGTAAALSASACRALLARENAVYAAWLDVVSASYRYLELVDGTWARARPGLRAGGAAPPDARPGPPPPHRPDDGVPPAGPWPERPSRCAAAGRG